MTVTSEGGGEPQVVSKVEETSSVVESSAASAVTVVDGEVVSSKEEAAMSKEETAATAIREGDEIKESSAIKMADGEVVEQHQASDFKETENVNKIVEDAIESGITEAAAIESSEAGIVAAEPLLVNSTQEAQTLPPPPEEVIAPLSEEIPAPEPIVMNGNPQDWMGTETSEIISPEELPPPSQELLPPLEVEVLPEPVHVNLVSSVPPSIEDLPPPADSSNEDLPPPTINTEECLAPVEDLPPPPAIVDDLPPFAPICDFPPPVEEVAITEAASAPLEEMVAPPPPTDSDADDRVDSPSGSKSSYSALVTPKGFVSSGATESSNRTSFMNSLLSDDEAVHETGSIR